MYTTPRGLIAAAFTQLWRVLFNPSGMNMPSGRNWATGPHSEFANTVRKTDKMELQNLVGTNSLVQFLPHVTIETKNLKSIRPVTLFQPLIEFRASKPKLFSLLRAIIIDVIYHKEQTFFLSATRTLISIVQ